MQIVSPNIKITYEQFFRVPTFWGAIHRLANFQGFKVQTAYQLMKIKGKLEKEQQVAQEIFNKLADEFCQKDEQGKMVPQVKDEKPIPGSFIIPTDKQAEWDKKMEEFSRTEIVVDRFPVLATDLEPARLSANELSALGPVICGLD